MRTAADPGGHRGVGAGADGGTHRVRLATSRRAVRRASPPTVVASTDVWGSVAQRRRRRPRQGARRSSPAPSADPHSYRGQPRRMRPPSPTRRWWSTTAAVTTTGSTTCWPATRAVSLGRRVTRCCRLTPASRSRPTSTSSTTWTPPKPVAAKIADKLAQVDPQPRRGLPRRTPQTSTAAPTRSPRPSRPSAASHPGAAVVATEPVAHYLLVAAGLTDKTPEAFASGRRAGHRPRRPPTSRPCST